MYGSIQKRFSLYLILSEASNLMINFFSAKIGHFQPLRLIQPMILISNNIDLHHQMETNLKFTTRLLKKK
jgi:hypothetical protein